MPEGSLTPSQYEILDAVWSAGKQGATVAEIWQQIAGQRGVARTTVLNLVDRLEKRGWLQRIDDPEGPNRFVAAVDRQRTKSELAREFVHDFFDGSAGNLVMSLLGSNRLTTEEVEELRQLLAEQKPSRSRRSKGE
jgi:BlaI family transcriptional regulator, penicillinase repressor